jgi:hypothetical protein
MSWFGLSTVDKAVDIVGGAAKSAIDIWDKSDFTGQERSNLFIKTVEMTKSVATSLSRRHLLYFIMAGIGLVLLIAVAYNHFGMTVELKGLMWIVAELKLGWAFVSAVSFYYLTHLVGAGKK